MGNGICAVQCPVPGYEYKSRLSNPLFCFIITIIYHYKLVRYIVNVAFL